MSHRRTRPSRTFVVIVFLLMALIIAAGLIAIEALDRRLWDYSRELRILTPVNLDEKTYIYMATIIAQTEAAATPTLVP